MAPIIISGQTDPVNITNTPARIIPAEAIASFLQHINFKSAFIWCKNDAIASSGIILAGLLVMFTSSSWPDIIIGAVIATIVCQGGIKVVRLSLNPITSVTEDDCCD